MIPHIYGTSYSIEADIVIPAGGAEGAIVANADFLGGFSLYVQERKLHHTYSFLVFLSRQTRPTPELVKLLGSLGDTNRLLRGISKGGTISSPEPLPAGHVIVRF